MIELKDFAIGYDGRTLLAGANATFKDGRLTALIGRNGTGKSTLLRAIAGLNPHYSGTVLLEGRDLRKMLPGETAKTLAFVNTERVRIANLRCEDVVAIGRAPYTNWMGRIQDADREIVARSLEAVGMSDYARRTMDTMSDGECQRIMIARALAQDTPIILLDEPTSFLDMPNRYELVTLLRRLSHDAGKCIVFPRTSWTLPCSSATASRSSTRRSSTACPRPRCVRAATSSASSKTRPSASMPSAAPSPSNPNRPQSLAELVGREYSVIKHSRLLYS